MAGALHSSIYSGMIIASAEPNAPAGWLACDGSFKLQSAYANLFSAIGHTYNLGVDPGDGTFKLPSLNNSMVPRGASVYYPPGTISGSNSHSHSFTTSANASINSNGEHSHSASGSFSISVSGGHSHNFNTGVSSNASGSNMGNAKAVGGTLGTANSGHAHDASMPGSTTDDAHSHPLTSVSQPQHGGGHNHGGPNVTNSTINVSADSTPHHLVFYIIKT